MGGKKKKGPEINMGKMRKGLQLSPSMVPFTVVPSPTVSSAVHSQVLGLCYYTNVGEEGGEKLPAEDQSIPLVFPGIRQTQMKAFGNSLLIS